MVRVCNTCREENPGTPTACHYCGAPMSDLGSLPAEGVYGRCVRCHAPFYGHGPLCSQCKEDVRSPLEQERQRRYRDR